MRDSRKFLFASHANLVSGALVQKHPKKQSGRSKPDAARRFPNPESSKAAGISAQATSIRDRRIVWLCLALIFLNVAVFAPVRSYGVTSYDDRGYVSENPEIAHGLTAEGLQWAFTGVHQSYWIPVVWVSYMLDVQFFGNNSGVFHTVNVGFHIANTLLLFLLLYRMTRLFYRSGFVAAIFAVHPLHVESVAWVTERKDMLSTLFFLFAIWTYVSYVRRPRFARYLAVCFLFALALMAKPMVVTLPFLLLLLDYWPLSRVSVADTARGSLGVPRATIVKLVREKIPLFALAAAGSVLTYFTQKTSGAIAGADLAGPGLRVSNAFVSYAAYIGKFFWPTKLAVFYPYPQSIPVWRLVVSFLLLAGISAAAVWAARTRPWFIVGWLWYLGALVPVIGLVQAGRQSMADRFTYIPLIGLLIIMAWSMPELSARWRRTPIFIIAPILAIATCAVLARKQVSFWKDNDTIWEHALQVSEESYIAHFNLGISLYEEGKVDQALSHFTRAVRMKPDYSDARNDLAVALANRGRTSDAIQELREGLRFNPNQARLHYNLGVLLRQQGQIQAGFDHVRTAVTLDPSYQDARRALEQMRGQLPKN